MIHAGMLLLPLLLALACRPNPTGIVVELKSELGPSAQVRGLELRVFRDNAAAPSGVAYLNHVQAPESQLIALAPESGSNQELLIEAVALGQKEGDVLASRKVRTRFWPHHVVVLPMVLQAQCVAIECPGNQTCVDGNCLVVPQANPEQLAPYYEDPDGTAGWRDASLPGDPQQDAGLAPPDVPPAPIAAPACAAVTCQSRPCCDGFSAYAWEPAGQGITARRDLILGPEFTTTGNSVSFNFGKADQVGTLNMALRTGHNMVEAQADLIASGFGDPKIAVTLETTGGKSGCFYPLDDKGFVQLNKGSGCWGEGGFVPVAISFRVRSLGEGTVTLTLRRLQIR